MSSERFLKWSIWSPLAIPIAVLVVVNAGRVMGLRPDSGSFAGFMFMSLLVGGVPYVVFASALTWFLRNASLRKLRLVSVCVPVPFALFMFIIAAAVAFPDLSQYGVFEAFIPASYYAAYALGVGYAYVAAVHLVLAVLQTIGVIDARRSAA